MTRSFGRGLLERLQQPAARHVAAATVAFVATIAVTVIVITRWPGGAPLVTPIIGLGAAFAAAISVSRLLDRRVRYALPRAMATTTPGNTTPTKPSSFRNCR